MQRRNSIISQGLDRRKSKSGSSVRSVQLQHITPEKAERDARNAAILAFTRARERSSMEATAWPPPRDSERPHAVRFNSSPSAGVKKMPIRRQRSVKSSRPSVSADEASPSFTNVDESTPKRRPDIPVRHHRVPEVRVQPVSCRSGRDPGLTSGVRGQAGDYLDACMTERAYITPEDDISSVPSSYRRLRKSKSMFTGFDKGGMRASRTMRGYNTMQRSSETAIPSQRSLVGEPWTASRLKAPRSMSFMRARRDTSSNLSTQSGCKTNSTADKENVPPCATFSSYHSALSRFKSAKPERVFRKTLRDKGDGQLKMAKDGSLRNKARKASRNLKCKLKSLFSVGKAGNDGAEIPPQQVHSTRTHGNLEDVFVDDNDEEEADPDHENTILSRVTSGLPSLHAIPSEQQLRSRRGSLESLPGVERKISDEKSRVTSWTNSDTNTFATVCSQGGACGSQRLSVIKETGVHRPRGKFKPTRRPPPPPPTAESQRIYTALVKRLQETQNQTQGVNTKRQHMVESFVNHGVVPARRDSSVAQSSGTRTPMTIRHVVPEDPLENDTMRNGSGSTVLGGEYQYQTQSEVSSTQATSVDDEHVYPPRSPSSTDSEADEPDRAAPASYTGMLCSRSQTTPHITVEECSSVPARPLSSRSSAFFGSPNCHLFRAQSPYRKALRCSMKAAAVAETIKSPKSPEFSPWMRSLDSLPIRCPSSCNTEAADVNMGREESVYSGTPNQNGKTAIRSSFSLVDEFPAPPGKPCHGDATIFVESPVYKPMKLQVPKNREVSTASSVEWKTWLSSKVSKLDSDNHQASQASGEKDSTVSPPVFRPLGHVRENAQISEEDEDSCISGLATGRTSSSSRHTLRDLVTRSRAQNAGDSSPTPRPILRRTVHLELNKKENEAPTSYTLGRESLRSTTPSTPGLQAPGEAQLDGSPREITRKTALAPLQSAQALGIRSPSMNNVTPSTTTARLVRRTAPPVGGLADEDSPIGMAVERQFGKVNGSPEKENWRRTILGIGVDENVGPGVKRWSRRVQQEDEDDEEDMEDDGEERVDYRAMGSKRMVDLFLSSRRRRIQGSSDDSDAFV